MAYIVLAKRVWQEHSLLQATMHALRLCSFDTAAFHASFFEICWESAARYGNNHRDTERPRYWDAYGGIRIWQILRTFQD